MGIRTAEAERIDPNSQSAGLAQRTILRNHFEVPLIKGDMRIWRFNSDGGGYCPVADAMQCFDQAGDT